MDIDKFEQATLEKLSPNVVALYNMKKAKYLNDGGAITVGKIVTLVIVCIVVAYILPIGLSALGNMNTSGMSEGEIALIQVIGVIVVLVIFAALAKEAE